MKQFVGIVCIVLMLTLLLVGCGRKNVSDNTEGRITEDTRPTTSERITTEATTTTAVPTETENRTDQSESEVPSETDSIEGRLRRGIMGNERY